MKGERCQWLNRCQQGTGVTSAGVYFWSFVFCRPVIWMRVSHTEARTLVRNIETAGSLGCSVFGGLCVGRQYSGLNSVPGETWAASLQL